MAALLLLVSALYKRGVKTRGQKGKAQELGSPFPVTVTAHTDTARAIVSRYKEAKRLS